MMVSAFGDSALRDCSCKIWMLLEMLSLLDKRFSLKRTATRISILIAMYSKRFTANQEMIRYIDEFERWFAQLDGMGSDMRVPEAHKARHHCS